MALQPNLPVADPPQGTSAEIALLLHELLQEVRRLRTIAELATGIDSE